MSKHTPGPWEVAAAAQYEEGKLMETVEYFVRQIGADIAVAADVATEADAALIAAAPDLLAACMEAFDEFMGTEGAFDVIANLSEAINKATGSARP